MGSTTCRHSAVKLIKVKTGEAEHLTVHQSTCKSSAIKYVIVQSRPGHVFASPLSPGVVLIVKSSGTNISANDNHIIVNFFYNINMAIGLLESGS